MTQQNEPDFGPDFVIILVGVAVFVAIMIASITWAALDQIETPGLVFILG